MNVIGSWACASSARGRQNPNFTRIVERGSSRCLQSRRVAIFIFVENIERSSKERPHVVVIVWAPENQFWAETDQWARGKRSTPAVRLEYLHITPITTAYEDDMLPFLLRLS
jgi:hypothetical protein